MGKRHKSHVETTTQKRVYDSFSQIDGYHPWRECVPESSLDYPVQEIPEGKVAYFNFRLAKEMGLIPERHPHKIYKELELQLLKTFCLRIVNEYDQAHEIQPVGQIKPNAYMATRYLQLQHRSKTGRTSGDGRSIWNGIYRNKGVTWDVSSRGTGVTRLAPGAVEANQPLKTGSTNFGYGCGLAEVSELYSSTIMSEILHSQGLRTERMLCIIDLGKGLGIGVRAAQNLLRPAHLFLHLKQGNLPALRRGLSYLVHRQISNGHWGKETRDPDNFIKIISQEFAEFAAFLDFHYIFAWMDWDGDNLLSHAGIIDYGSIRQFGLRHEKYRYDDVDRFSTNLNEQKEKARQTVQVFAQLANFVKTGTKRPLVKFKNHPDVKSFHRTFEDVRLREFLKILGLEPDLGKILPTLTPHQQRLAKKALNALMAVEKIHSAYPTRKLPDGIHRPAIYSRRKLLKYLHEVLMASPGDGWSAQEAHLKSLAKGKRGKDRSLSRSRRKKLMAFFDSILPLIQSLTRGQQPPIDLEDLALSLKNYCEHPVCTGNGVESMVDIILSSKSPLAESQILVDRLVTHFGGTDGKKFGPEQGVDEGVSQVLESCLWAAQQMEEDI